MKSKTEYLTFDTKTKHAFVNITPDVRNIVKESSAKWIISDRTHIARSNSGNDNITSFAISFPMHNESIWLRSLYNRYLV